MLSKCLNAVVKSPKCKATIELVFDKSIFSRKTMTDLRVSEIVDMKGIWQRRHCIAYTVDKTVNYKLI